jgi:hypothetical protein
MVDETRATGVVKRLQRYLDRQDHIFGGTIGEQSTPNFQLRLGSEYAGWKNEVQGPYRSACAEVELTEDILEFRRLACQHSNEYDFRLTCRFYRAYLFACVTLVDAFINRHILLAKHDNFTSPAFAELKGKKKFKARLLLWFAVCSNDDPATFFSSREWCHLQEIRVKRNALLHALEPIFMYSIKEVQVYLNKVRIRIGQSLLRLREAHRKPTLAFIEKLRTAPLVDFHEIRFKADGNHRVRRIHGR